MVNKIQEKNKKQIQTQTKHVKDNKTIIESIKKSIQNDKIKPIFNMLFNLDVCIVILIIVLVLIVLSGFFSLAERKVMAIVQTRIGPALFLFGLLTPITDGIKLFIKFVLFVVSVDIFYFLGGLFITLYTMYFT